MTKYFVSLVVLFLSFQPFIAHAQKSILPEEAKNHIGEVTTVCGSVASTYFSSKTRRQLTLIDLNKAYPNQIFTIVIEAPKRSKFPQPPEEMYKDKEICVKGKISSYEGTPEIIVEQPSQIEIK
jgi:rRNA processing protein Gar1